MSQGLQWALLGAQLVTVISAIVVTFHPNILYAAIGLLFSFLGVSVMFLFAGADFLAGAQIVIYVGGVVILILFAIMLTHWLYQMQLRDTRTKFVLPVLVLVLGLFPLLFSLVNELSHPPVPTNFAEFATSPKTSAVGTALLGQYLLPFEAVTVLLLGALVGAVWLARPGEK